MSDNAEADALAAVRALRRQVVRGNLLLTQQNEILTQQNRSLTGEVSDQRVVIIQILTRIERLEAYAQNSRNGFRVQFSPLATQELHAMGRRMDHLDRNNNTTASARSSASVNSVGGVRQATVVTLPTAGGLLIGADQREAVHHALNAPNAIVAAPNNENEAQNSAPARRAAAATLPTSGRMLIGVDQREAVQPALNAPDAFVAGPNNENEAPRFHIRLENRMNAAQHRVLIQAAMQDEAPHQDSLGHNAAVIVQLREVERFNGRGIPLAPPQTLYWADECAVCNDGEANFYSRNCGHICLCDACAVNLVIHSRDLRCIICRRAVNSSPRFQFAYRP
ncbi:hypothetical protein GPALN_003783 [Globodera pallida]|nr:hypothetical protein GPALN_003783 [Globodera pallida]